MDETLIQKLRALWGAHADGPLKDILHAALEIAREPREPDNPLTERDELKRAAYLLRGTYGEKGLQRAADISERLQTPFARRVEKMLEWMVRSEERQIELDRYGILDTAPEPPFDDIAFIAAHALDAPFAAINLIDGERQWSKAMVGGTERETPVEESACGSVLGVEEVVIIPDMREDGRTSHLRAVTTDGMRFYASAPIKSQNGVILGRLCVVDYQTRSDLEPGQAEVLFGLARQVTAQLELRRLLVKNSEPTGDHSNIDKRLADGKSAKMEEDIGG